MTDDQAGRHFDRGLRELEGFFRGADSSTVAAAVEAFAEAVARDRDNAVYWMALGFTRDVADQPAAALAALREAGSSSWR